MARWTLWALLPIVASLSAGCGGGAKGPVEIAFVSTRDGDYAVFGMRAGGKGEHRLTKKKGDPATAEGLFFQVGPAWSPDGRLIAFSSRREGKGHIYVMNADGTGTRRITSGRQDDLDPSWSPDGRRIVFAREGALFVVSARGGKATRLGRDPGNATDPAWSPDGTLIAHSYRQPGSAIREMWLIRPDGTGRRQLTTLKAVSVAPAWSPDGSRIAFATDADGSYDISTIGVDGKVPRNETTGPADDFEPAWSPDGRTIVFSRDGVLFTLGPEGAEHKLSSGKNDSSPAWRPRVPAPGR